MSIVNEDKNDRVMVFIDMRNIIKSAQAACPGPFKVDFADMTRKLAAGRPVVGAYIFDGMNMDGSGAVHRHLQKDGFRVRLRNSYDTENCSQKEVDVAMAIEMVLQAERGNFDTAIVVSGDGDFVPAVETMQSFGRVVEVASFNGSRSGNLMRSADRYVNLGMLDILIMHADEDGESGEGEVPAEDDGSEAKDPAEDIPAGETGPDAEDTAEEVPAEVPPEGEGPAAGTEEAVVTPGEPKEE